MMVYTHMNTGTRVHYMHFIYPSNDGVYTYGHSGAVNVSALQTSKLHLAVACTFPYILVHCTPTSWQPLSSSACIYKL